MPYAANAARWDRAEQITTGPFRGPSTIASTTISHARTIVQSFHPMDRRRAVGLLGLKTFDPASSSDPSPRCPAQCCRSLSGPGLAATLPPGFRTPAPRGQSDNRTSSSPDSNQLFGKRMEHPPAAKACLNVHDLLSSPFGDDRTEQGRSRVAMHQRDTVGPRRISAPRSPPRDCVLREIATKARQFLAPACSRSRHRCRAQSRLE